MGKTKERKMDEIREAQYKNLRDCLERNLIIPILGWDYYNMGNDVYQCDRETTLDLKREFDKRTGTIKIYQILLVISMTINICMGIITLVHII